MKLETPDGQEHEIDLDQFKNELTITIPIEEGLESHDIFSMLVSGYSDIFRKDHIGYWARGLSYSQDHLAWLCSIDEKITFPIIENDAIKYWEENPDIDKFKLGGYEFFVIDVKFACKAVAEIYKKWGNNPNWDAETIDYAVQMVLFGKLVYA